MNLDNRGGGLEISETDGIGSSFEFRENGAIASEYPFHAFDDVKHGLCSDHIHIVRLLVD